MLNPAWLFVYDGHLFYVLGSDSDRTLICDLTTGQWYQWHTAPRLYWNMQRGVIWHGHVLAADVALPRIWLLDPTATGDEGTFPIERVVTGFQPHYGRNSLRQGALRLTASVGEPSVEAAAVIMRFSDDEGETWSPDYPITLLDGDTAQELKFRSLGRIRAPGRLWEIRDSGGLVRIDGADADIMDE